jgi:shikimate dehydrogenase
VPRKSATGCNERNSDGRGRIEVALIGAGIGSSLSPALHEREGRILGFDYRYDLYDLVELGRQPEDVGTLVEQARADGLRGLNITHPCKQTVVAALDLLAPEADALGAVNTVVFTAEGAVGHNTDWPGFQQSFASALPDARWWRHGGVPGCRIARAVHGSGARPRPDGEPPGRARGAGA